MSVLNIFSTANVIFSIKTFLAGMLAYFIAIRFDVAKPFWAVATVYIIAHPLSGAVSSKGAYRLVGTVIGAAATLIMVPNLVNEPILLSGAIILWVSACTFIRLLDRTPRGYVPMLAGYTVLLAGLPLVSVPENTFDTVVSRVEEIGIAIICSSIISHIIFPARVGAVLISRIDSWLAKAQNLLRETVNEAVKVHDHKMARHQLATEAMDIRLLTVHLEFDGSRYRHLIEQMKFLQHRMVALIPLLGELEDLHRAISTLGTNRAKQALQSISEWAHLPKKEPKNDVTLINLNGLRDARCSYEQLVLINASRNLVNITDLSNECSQQRTSINEENTIKTKRRNNTHRVKYPALHRDIGMATLSAFAVAICLASSTFLWIASGWPDGMTFAQISGVLCCLLAAMDDPVPAMRKFVYVSIGSMLAAFIYGFAILPMIDGFIPLVAVLALFLLPAGVCLAVPSLAILGMGLCINFPLLLTLQAKPQSDFLAFTNTGISTILAMVWTILVCSIFRSVKAETNARRLLSVVKKHFRRIASGEHRSSYSTHHHVIDVASLFASRAAKLPPSSYAADTDLVRSLRLALTLIALQELCGHLPTDMLKKTDAVLKLMSTFKDGAALHHSERREKILAVLDELIHHGLSKIRIAEEDELLVQAVALRISLAPNAEPPASKLSTFGRAEI